MNAIIQFGAVAGLSLAAAGATWLINGRPVAPEVTTVECDPALVKDDEICLAEMPEDVFWIDARSRKEWEKNGVEGSVLWNLDPAEDDKAFEAEAASGIFASGAPLVVVYCGSEACGTSRQIADRIRSLGLGPEIKILFGGWDALESLRIPIK